MHFSTEPGGDKSDVRDGADSANPGACRGRRGAYCETSEPPARHAEPQPHTGCGAVGSIAAAAVAEAKKHNWKENVAVVDSTGYLVAFSRMDGAQLASVAIAEHKARAAVTFRRDTKIFETNVDSGLVYQLSHDGIVASRGGIPLVEGGKLISAIGVSCATGSQDEVCAKAGAATVNK